MFFMALVMTWATKSRLDSRNATSWKLLFSSSSAAEMHHTRFDRSMVLYPCRDAATAAPTAPSSAGRINDRCPPAFTAVSNVTQISCGLNMSRCFVSFTTVLSIRAGGAKPHDAMALKASANSWGAKPIHFVSPAPWATTLNNRRIIGELVPDDARANAPQRTARSCGHHWFHTPPSPSRWAFGFGLKSAQVRCTAKEYTRAALSFARSRPFPASSVGIPSFAKAQQMLDTLLAV
mmetsp:Transcript_46191/g.133070  ORF Transcript_46191/g.133070 Transcript_46191/m.133070 type:complete len:235 (-) Transcript_46191:499-1203(-)